MEIFEYLLLYAGTQDVDHRGVMEAKFLQRISRVVEMTRLIKVCFSTLPLSLHW